MSRLAVRALSLVLVGTAGSVLLASSAIIGVVSAEGTFHLDNSAASGQATLFDGNVIQTGASSTRLDLKDGTWMRLSTNSRARISGHDVSLEGGIAEIGAAKDYRILAKTLRISPAGSDSVIRVEVAGDHRVLVAAYTASAQVSNRTGLLVATLQPGDTLSFDPQFALVTSTGCLLTKSGRFMLVNPNDTTRIVELRGADLGREVGNQVAVNGNVIPGATPMAGASQVLGVTATLALVATGGCAETAAKVGADALPAATGSKPPPGHAIKPRSTTPYIVGGVAVAGGAIGIVAATHKSSTSNP